METVIHTASGRIFGGRFQCEKPLKAAPGTATWLGRDLAQGLSVVIKTVTLAEMTPAAHIRLEHEARVLADIQSSCLTPVIDVGRENGQAYIVTPAISGVTLETRLACGPLSLPESLLVGRSLCAALQHVHDRGVLHRDIKPSNIIVDHGVPLSRVTLIDFGFARSSSLDPSIRDIPVGTVQYMAPEQAGVLDRPTDERSDLYAVGLVLFACVAGRPPFHADRVGEMLRHHLSTPPPALRDLGYHVPRALDDVIQRLLRKDPDGRYQTAQAVLADLTELGEALARGDVDPVIVVGARDRRRTLAEPAFVGREQELARLDAQLAGARQGRGGLVLVEAESGGGKTRLLEEFARRSARCGAWVLRGQGVDQAALRPFQLLDGVVQGLTTRFQADPSSIGRLRSRLGDQLEAACEALPQLAPFLGPGTGGSIGQEEHGEVRSLRALAALLDGLGSEHQPALIVLDDVQWADELTLKLIEHWYRRHERSETLTTTGAHVLIAAAFRTEEVAADHPLRRVPAAALALAPFAAQDIRCMAESMAGSLPDAALDVVVGLADGSPFMAAAVLQGLVEIGALVPSCGDDGASWMVHQDVVADVQSCRRAGVFLARRLDRLPAATLRLLSVGAVLGREFDPRLAGDLAGLPTDEAATGCLEARKRHLIWTDGGETHWTFAHDKIREALLARLGDEERRRFHALAGARIEAEDSSRIFDLAYHFDAAGDSARALPYALQAADQARARYALAIAERQYRIAARGIRAEDRATQRRVAEGLGDVLMLGGRYEEADAQLRKAVSLADAPLMKAQLEGRLGELAFKRGDVRTASAALESALALLGHPLARSWWAALGLAVWETVVQVAHSLFPRVFVARRRAEGDRAKHDLLVARLYSRLAYANWFARGTIPTLWAHLRELNLAERYPPSKELGQAYANHSAVMTMLPYFRRGIAYAEKGLAIRGRLGDVWGVAQSKHFYGVLLLAAARNADALQFFREARDGFERTGDLWERNNALFNEAYSLYSLGELDGATALGRRVLQSGQEIGNVRDIVLGLEICAKASGGQVPRELARRELDRHTTDVLTGVTVLQAEAACLLVEHRPREASTILLRAQDLADKAGLRNAYVSSVSTWLVTALRQELERRSPFDTTREKKLYGRLRWATRHALRLARRYRNNLPHALREAGLLAAMQGKPRKARRCLDESLAVAEQQGAKFEHAQTLLARGQVGSALGWAGATQEVERAKAALRALGAHWVLGQEAPAETPRPVTPALIERFDTVLTSGRQIAGALTRPAVYTALRDAALALLRGETCLVLEVDGAPRPATQAPHIRVVSCEPHQNAPFSRTVVERAIETGRPVAASDGVGETTTESLVLAGVRSVLCAPITVRGRVIGCFYVTHRQVGGLFGPDEERLAEFIATLTGAALENVEGLAKTESQLIAGSAAGLAHAIKNPVSLIRAYVQLLRTGVGCRDPEVTNRYLHTINGALDRINELMDRLKRVPIHASRKAPIALDQLMDQAAGEIRPLFSETMGYRMAVDVDPRTPSHIMADGDQVALALINLLTNACEAMPDGGLVRISAQPAGAHGVAISISDHGSGMTPAIQTRLFQPFVTTKPQGTGLGLWVCKTIVEQHHGGSIVVKSEPGSGTTVTITLPIGDAADNLMCGFRQRPEGGRWNQQPT